MTSEQTRPDNSHIRNVLALIERSPDQGAGWRKVSRFVWPHLASMPDDLVERESLPDGTNRIRMTAAGQAVLTYGGE